MANHTCSPYPGTTECDFPETAHPGFPCKHPILFECNDCDADGMSETEAFDHSREYWHCVGDNAGHMEVYCYRMDH